MKKLLDPKWRLTHLYQIRTKVPGYEGKTVTFAPNQVQKKIYQKLEDGWKRVIILKPRKLGTTTATILYLLDKAMYSPNMMCRTIAHRKQTVGELFNDIARFAFDRIPENLRIPQRYSTRSELDFAEIGSKYSIDVEARGLTPTYLHLSEVAYVDDEAKLEDTLESLPLTAVGIAESTANGRGNWFEQTFTQNWEMLQAGQTPIWYPLFFAWFEDPTNKLLWKPETSTLTFEDEARELQARFNLSDDQILWWDRKKSQLKQRMPELYPSTPDEAFIFSTGKVYNEFRPELHEIAPVQFKDFKVAMDYGQTNPTAILLIHQDHDGNFIVFDEFYRRECPIKETCKWLKKRGITRIHYPDPSMFAKTQVSAVYRAGQQHRSSIADEFKRYGIHLSRGAQNDIPAGIVRVKEYLNFDRERIHPFKRDIFGESVKGSPRLFITENCSNLKWEFYNYRWPDDPKGALNRQSYETPRKENDHALDALRYAMLTWAKSLAQEEEEILPNTPRWFMSKMKGRSKTIAY